MRDPLGYVVEVRAPGGRLEIATTAKDWHGVYLLVAGSTGPAPLPDCPRRVGAQCQAENAGWRTLVRRIRLD